MLNPGALVVISIALLLWGTHMVTSGMLRGYAGFLRIKLGSALESSPKAFCAGILATLGLQSSTATGLMAASFLEHGIFGLTTGLVMMLGANVGTALVAKLLSFPIVHIVPWLIVGGIWIFRRSKSTRGRSVGRVGIGLGLMLFGLNQLGEAAMPLAQSPLASAILDSLDNQILIPMILGAIITWALHGSVGVVLIVATLLATGVIPVLPALGLVLGANFGGALGPYLETQGIVAKRLPLGNLIVRGVACLIVAPLLPLILSITPQSILDMPHLAVDFHVAFNLLAALFAWPFSKTLAKSLKKLLPPPPALSDPATPEHLDDELLAHPYLALVAAERECVRLGAQAETLIRDLEPILLDPDPLRGESLIKHTQSSAKLAHQIRLYLGRLSRGGMGENDVNRSLELQSFALGVEQSLDIIKDLGQERKNGQTPVSSFLAKEEKEMISKGYSLIQSVCRDTIAVLMTGNIEMSKDIVSSRDEFRSMERHALSRQLQVKNSPGQSQAIDKWLQSLQYMRRIHSQWTSLSHQVLENAGLLRGRLMEVSSMSTDDEEDIEESTSKNSDDFNENNQVD